MILRACLVVVLTLTACSGSTGLGDPCTLVKANPAGGKAIPIQERELPVARADYVTFASPSCAEVCVRDADQPRTGNNDALATGYCSSPCAGTGASCGDPAFTCRALLLDEATLAALCSSDAVPCRSFPNGPKTFFCVQGAR